MSKIGTEEVKRLSQLARIQLTEEETSRLAVELGQIVEFVEQLDAVDTKGVEPTSQVTGMVDVWRPDEVAAKTTTQEELLKNAPEQKDGYIKVRRVLG